MRSGLPYLLLLPIVLFITTRLILYSKLEQTTGEVFSLSEGFSPSLGGGGHEIVYPTFRYTVNDSSYFLHTANRLLLEDYYEGEKVTVLYDREDHYENKVFVNSFTGFWFPMRYAYLLGLFTAFMYAIAVIVDAVFDSNSKRTAAVAIALMPTILVMLAAYRVDKDDSTNKKQRSTSSNYLPVDQGIDPKIRHVVDSLISAQED